MTFSSRHFRLFAVAATSFLLACIAMLALLVSGHRLDRALESVEATYQVMHELERLLSDMRESENSQRDYLFTGSATHLTAHAAGRAAAMARLERLPKMLKGSASQEAALDRLAKLIAGRFDEFDRTLEMRRDTGRDAALGLLGKHHEGNVTDLIEDLILGMVAEEERMLLGEKRDSERLFLRATLFSAMAFLLSIPLLVLVLTLLRRDAKAQAEIARALARSNEELNVRVAQRTKELEAALKAREVFFAKMSHELRTPLNAVIGFADLIATEAFGPVGRPRYKEYAADIRLSGEHLLALINDILDAAKSHQGELDLEETQVDPAELVRSVARLMAPRAASRRISLEVEGSSDPAALSCDPQRMRQILLNLLSNAIKFTPEGGEVKVGYGIVNAGPTFHVLDTGIGMSQEDLHQALTPFGQAGKPSAGVEAGTGLGLPLTRELVELHGGVLQIETAPGRGTLVEVRLPVSRLCAAAA